MPRPRKSGLERAAEAGQFLAVRSFFQLLVALLATFLPALGAVPDEIRGSLEKIIPEAIRLLEAKEYGAFLETMMAPEDLAKVMEEKTFVEFAARFGEKKAASLLAILKTVKDRKPLISGDGNLATYSLPVELDAPKNMLTFERIDGRWFIRN